MTETHNVRGEDMRAWMTQRDKVSFLKALPEKLSTPAKESIWYTLVGPDAVSFAGC